MTVRPLVPFRFARRNRLVHRLRMLDHVRWPRDVRFRWLFDHTVHYCNMLAAGENQRKVRRQQRMNSEGLLTA